MVKFAKYARVTGLFTAFVMAFLTTVLLYGMSSASLSVNATASVRPPGACTYSNPWQISEQEHLIWMNEYFNYNTTGYFFEFPQN